MVKASFAAAAARFVTSFGLAGLVLVIAATAVARLWPLFDLTAQFALAATFGLGLLAAAFLALAAPRRAAVAAAAGLFGVWLVHMPAPLPACPAGTQTTRLLFFNMWARNTDPDGTVAFLKSSNADIIVLTEISYAFRDKFDGLRKDYPATSEWLDGREWLGMLSRYPMENISNRIRDVEGPRSFEAQIAYLPAGALTVVGTHLTRPWPLGAVGEQVRQAGGLARATAKIDGPKIVAGDFNAVTWGAIVAQVAAVAGVRPVPSWGTWHARLPLPARMPIDQILVGDGFLCASKTVGPLLGSDHRPVWIDFALKPTDPA